MLILGDHVAIMLMGALNRMFKALMRNGPVSQMLEG